LYYVVDPSGKSHDQSWPWVFQKKIFRLIFVEFMFKTQWPNQVWQWPNQVEQFLNQGFLQNRQIY